MGHCRARNRLAQLPYFGTMGIDERLKGRVGRLDKKKEPRLPERLLEQPMSYGEFARLPDLEGIRYELDDGYLQLMTPAPSPKHQLIAQQIEHRLVRSCSGEYVVFLAPIDVILSEKEVKQPDLVLLHRSRIGLVTQRGIEGPPDVVAEILSPHSAKRDRSVKRRAYAKYGIPEYWIVDIGNESLEQYVLRGESYELCEVFSGEEPVRSERIACASFAMAEILAALPDLPNG